ncbi:MAG: gamma-glutamyl-gamma-aminobutyrate hydrolase family protein, partial [Mesorhizobium sp.]
MEKSPGIAYFAGRTSFAQMEHRAKMHQPLVAISTDVRQFDNYTWHAAP